MYFMSLTYDSDLAFCVLWNANLLFQFIPLSV